MSLADDFDAAVTHSTNGFLTLDAKLARQVAARLRELERLIDNPEDAKTRAIRAMKGYEAIQQQCEECLKEEQRSATPVAWHSPDWKIITRTEDRWAWSVATEPLYAAPTFDAERAMELADEMAERYADKASLYVHYPTALTAYLEAREALRSYLEGKTT